MPDFLPPGAWGWDAAALEAAAERIARLSVRHLNGVSSLPVFQPVPPGMAERFRSEEWPDQASSVNDLVADIEEILSYPFGNGHPRFHAWVNSPPDRAAVLASIAASAMNPSCAGGNHAAVHLERQVIRWLAEMIGMPSGAGGLLMSGTSLATITALAAARQAKAGFDVRAEGLSGKALLTVYASSEVHSCVTKAIELLGIGTSNLHLLPAGPDFRLDPGRLEAELRLGRSRGEHPFAVVATAGTVSAGAIDPLEEIADVCARNDVWLHVDSAYGAPAVLTERYREILSGLRRADSVSLDPHKWLYVPVDAAALIVRDPERLREAFSLVPPYLKVEFDPNGVSDAPWFSEYGPEQTRPFRALRIWAALKSTGKAGYAKLIDHDLDLAARLAEAVIQQRELELDAHGLSIVCFHHDGDDAMQEEIARRIQLGGEAFLTTTKVKGRTVLRACFVNPLTSDDDVDALISLVARTASQIRREQVTSR